MCEQLGASVPCGSAFGVCIDGAESVCSVHWEHAPLGELEHAPSAVCCLIYMSFAVCCLLFVVCDAECSVVNPWLVVCGFWFVM